VTAIFEKRKLDPQTRYTVPRQTSNFNGISSARCP
jgi:hypothetical protein